MFIPLHIIISVIMAIVITLFFEEPIRKKLKQLRDNRKKERTENQSSNSGRRGIDNAHQSKGRGEVVKEIHLFCNN